MAEIQKPLKDLKQKLNTTRKMQSFMVSEHKSGKKAAAQVAPQVNLSGLLIFDFRSTPAKPLPKVLPTPIAITRRLPSTSVYPEPFARLGRQV